MTGSTPPSPHSEDELRRLRERVYGPHGSPSAVEVARLHELESGTPRDSDDRVEPEPTDRVDAEPEDTGADDAVDTDSANTGATSVTESAAEPSDSRAPGPRQFPWRAVVSTVIVAVAVGGVAFATGFAAGTVGSTPAAPDDLPELLLPQTEEDVVTTDPNDSLAETIDLASTRFVARVDGLDVFLARPAASAGVCLFTRVASSSAFSGIGCSGGTPGQKPGLGYGMVGGLQLYVGDPAGPVTGDPIRLSESVTAYVS